jgi:DNA-binding Xre family transcriptional regulator
MPNDPVMLLSYINMKLRDEYSSLESLCDDLDVNMDDILEKLKNINYYYDKEQNQFK